MWKKALWVYLGLYVVGIVGLMIYYVVTNVHTGELQLISLIMPLFFFLPAGVVAWGLRGKKVSILLTLLGLLIMAVPVAGTLHMNDMSFATIGKVLLFLPMIAGLIYVGYKRLFKK